jgi:hypothetical protein
MEKRALTNILRDALREGKAFKMFNIAISLGISVADFS